MRPLVYIQIISAIILITGCKVQQPVILNDTVLVEHTVVKDSLITLPADSIWLTAWFECDSLNQVILKELEEKTTDTIIKQVTVFKEGKLRVTTLIDSQQVYIEWKERHDTTTITSTIIKEVEVEVEVVKKPGWLLLLAGLGIGAIVLLIGLLIIKFK